MDNTSCMDNIFNGNIMDNKDNISLTDNISIMDSSSTMDNISFIDSKGNVSIVNIEKFCKRCLPNRKVNIFEF